MTREEAIEILKTSTMKDTLSDQWQEAYKMAIQALSQEPTEKPMTVDEMEREYEKSKALFHKIVECDDAVSRMALGRSKMCDGIDCYNCPFWVIREGQRICRISEYVKDLPSVTQKSVIEDIKAEIKAEMEEHRDIDDFSKGVGYGLRSAIGIIERCEDGK